MLQQGYMMNEQPWKVWNSETCHMTQYTPYTVYKISVRYMKQNTVKDFIGMDRGSCLMQAEVAVELDDEIMMIESESEERLYKREQL